MKLRPTNLTFTEPALKTRSSSSKEDNNNLTYTVFTTKIITYSTRIITYDHLLTNPTR